MAQILQFKFKFYKKKLKKFREIDNYISIVIFESRPENIYVITLILN